MKKGTERRRKGEQQGYSEYRKVTRKPDKLFEVQEEDYTTYLETSEKTILDMAVKIAEKIVGTKMKKMMNILVSSKKSSKRGERFSQKSACMYIHSHYDRTLIAKRRTNDRFFQM